MAVRLADPLARLRSVRSIVLLAILVVTAIGATAGLAVWHNRRLALAEHRRSMNDMGVVLAEQTARHAQVIDLMLRTVQARIAAIGPSNQADLRDRVGTRGFHDYLVESARNVPQLDALVLVDADGMALNSSRAWPAPRVDGGGRGYHEHFKNNNDPGLFIDALSRSHASGRLNLFFARRVNGPGGEFLGVVLGVADIGQLIDFYRTAGAGPGQSVTLLRRDGTMLVRHPNPEAAIGVRLPPESPWYASVAAGGGGYITPGVLDGTPSLVSVHPLRDYPLVVDVLMQEADALAQWRGDSIVIACLAMCAALTFGALFGALACQFRGQARQNARLERGRRRFDAVLDNVSQGICFFDGDKRLLLSNRRYAEIYGLTPEMTRAGCSLEEIIRHRDAIGTGVAMTDADQLAWRNGLASSAQPSRNVRELRDGRFVETYYQPMPDGGWVATHEDITDRQRATAAIAFMARHDALTRLPNRVMFRERMEQAIAMAGRGSGFAVFCLDMDDFKQVNDTLGHPIGDRLLVAAADRLAACVREGDTVARLGGDEFAIIQLALQRPDDAEVLAGRLIAAFRQPFDIEGQQIVSGVSVGVTVASNDDLSYDALMRNADIALYLAKTEGRGTARFFEPDMDARIHQRRLLERDLQGAVERGEFELHYQPQINLADDALVGFEALLRWRHPVRGLVSPLDFIPVTEETGLIVPIGDWVLRTACFEAENWPLDIRVAVNLSPVQFRKGGVVETVRGALAASGLRADRLELEITESVFLRDTERTLAALRQLRAMGIGVALDDFGTGYSSLGYLRSFPFSKLKIDQSFVRDLTTNKESMSIVRAVTGLGHSLGMRTTAEGVETAEQLARLRNKGCSEVQGYLFGRPTPARELPALIRKLLRTDDAVPRSVREP